MTRRHRLYALAAVTFALVLWSAAASDRSTILPTPVAVLKALWQMLSEGILLHDVVATLERVLIGILVGVGLGVFVGALTGVSRGFGAAIEPLVRLIRPIPAVALIPVAIAWLGVGEASKYFIVAWAAFFPVWVSTYHGVRSVPDEFIWTATVLGADHRRRVLSVVIPFALREILAGVEVSIGLGFAASVVAEMSGAAYGVGFRVFESHLVFRYDRMFASLVAIAALGAMFDAFFRIGVARMCPWIRQ